VEMFVAQGIAQWEIWTGQRAPGAAMRRAVLRALAAEERASARQSARTSARTSPNSTLKMTAPDAASQANTP
jgi:hypothetical protein